MQKYRLQLSKKQLFAELRGLIQSGSTVQLFYKRQTYGGLTYSELTILGGITK